MGLFLHKGRGGGGSKVIGSSAPLFNDTKWDMREGKDDTPDDSSHRQKEHSSCEDVVFNNFPSFGD
jgi:hypothetical protein